jgi:hypothetical protein
VGPGAAGTSTSPPDCATYVACLAQIIDPQLLSRPCPYDNTKILGHQIAIAIGKYRNISNHCVPESIANNTVLVGRGSSNPKYALVHFKNAFASQLIMFAVFGSNNNIDKLSDYFNQPIYADYVRPLINFFVEHLNPYNELSYADINQKSRINFEKNMKSKVSAFGIWHHGYITNESFRSGANRMDSQICRGLDVYLAICTDWVFKDDLWTSIHPQKLFVPPRMASPEFWKRNKVWKYHPFPALIDPTIVELMRLAPVVPTLAQQWQLDVAWLTTQPQQRNANPPQQPDAAANQRANVDPPQQPDAAANQRANVDPPQQPNVDPPQQPNAIDPAAANAFAELSARRRRVIRQAVTQHAADATNNVSLSENQVDNLENRIDRIQAQFQSNGTICGICHDSAGPEEIGDPPIFATGEDCNCLFHRFCLRTYIGRRAGPQYPRHASNNCPLCTRRISRDIAVSDVELGIVMDIRTDEEMVNDITSLLDESFTD